MTDTTMAAYLEALTNTAKAASTAELDHQKAAARRAAELKVERAFTWRRLNLMRATAAAVRGAADTEAAIAAGRDALLRATGWTGATQAQRDVADRFAPVSAAVRAAVTGDDALADPAAALSAFEDWYATERGVPFLALMERETVELPLVEV